jgi:cyanophycinase
VRIALLGAGEFEPWSEAIDRWALDGSGDGRVVIVPTASAPEGDDSFAGWAAKGLDHYGALGMHAAVLPLKTRAHAQDPSVAELIRDASAVYFSGGNPYYLARTIDGTRFWDVLMEEMQRGAAYVGCSAGVACLTEVTYDSDVDDILAEATYKPGLGFVRRSMFAPHWDRVEEWFPGAQAFMQARTPPGETLIALDEDTAMVGDGTAWRVLGRAGVHVYRDGSWDHHASGSTFDLALDLAR